MANNANNFNIWNGGNCGCGDRVSECNTIFQKVDTLPSTGDATRNHSYILPNNTVWTLNSDGTGFVQLNGSDAEQKQQLETIQKSLGSKITLKANNLPAVEAGLGDVFEVDFTNLETTFEDHKLTIKQTESSEQAVYSVSKTIKNEEINPPVEAVMFATVEKLGTNLIRLNYQLSVPYNAEEAPTDFDVSELVNDLAKSMAGDGYTITNLTPGSYALQVIAFDGASLPTNVSLTINKPTNGDYVVTLSAYNGFQGDDLLLSGQVILKIAPKE